MATIAYLNPAAAPPTHLNGRLRNTVVATVSPTDSGDTAQITHSFNLSAAELAAGWPTVLIEPLTANAGPANWSIQSFDSNYIGLIKNNSTANGESTSTTPQIRVAISRPHSIFR